MSYMCPHCNSFPLADYIWLSLSETPRSGGAASCGENYEWKQPYRLLVVQTGDCIDDATLFIWSMH